MNGILLPGGIPPKPDKIRVHVAADVIGCTERTVRRYAETGTITAERDGKRRWLLSRVEAEKMHRERSLSCLR